MRMAFVIIDLALRSRGVTALLVEAFFIELGMSKSQLEKLSPRINELPFDSVRKMMSTQHRKGEKTIVYTKGAMDQILKHCDMILKDGKVEPLMDQDLQNIRNAASKMAEKALRVLALAMRESQDLKEEHLIFVGLVGMVDPPRPAAKSAVATLKGAGITTIMVNPVITPVSNMAAKRPKRPLGSLLFIGSFPQYT